MYVASLAEVTSSLHRACRANEKFLFKLSPSGMYFKVHKPDEFLFVARFALGDLFLTDSVKLESKKRNQIAFEVDATNITNALRAASSALSTIVKLSTRSGLPVLSFQIEMMGLSEKFFLIQDCPIQLLKGAEVDEVWDPPEPASSWTAELPPLESILGVANRMRQVGGEIATLSFGRGRQSGSKNNSPGSPEEGSDDGNDDGEADDRENEGGQANGEQDGKAASPQRGMRLRVETSVVTVDTQFPNCHLHSVANGGRHVSTNFRLKPFLAALQISVLIPHDFALARLVKDSFVMLCLPVLHLAKSHATCCVWAVSDE